MPDCPSLNYSLRAKPHNKTLIAKTTQLNDQDFIIRSIYSIRTHIDCTLNFALNISSILPCLLCFVCILIAPPVNILCRPISTIVLMVAFVNLILKKMMMMMMMNVKLLSFSPKMQRVLGLTASHCNL